MVDKLIERLPLLIELSLLLGIPLSAPLFEALCPLLPVLLLLLDLFSLLPLKLQLLSHSEAHVLMLPRDLLSDPGLILPLLLSNPLPDLLLLLGGCLLPRGLHRPYQGLALPESFLDLLLMHLEQVELAALCGQLLLDLVHSRFIGPLAQSEAEGRGLGEELLQRHVGVHHGFRELVH